MAASLSITASCSAAPWMATRASLEVSRGPTASLSLFTFSTSSSSSTTIRSASSTSTARSPLLHCSFLSTAFFSSFSGLSLGLDLNSNVGIRKDRGSGLVMRAGKAALCQTKRNRSRKSLARTHGFRRRMRTTSGRAVLKRRRAKGRKVLCTKSNPNSGKRA